MLLLRETYFSRFSVGKVLQNFVQFEASANFGFNRRNRQTI